MKRIRKQLLAALLATVMATGLLGEGVALATDAQPTLAERQETAAEADQSFQLVIRTPTNNITFQLPVSSSLNGIDNAKGYDWLIDWGDGNTQQVAGLSKRDTGIPHTYAAARDYTITITPNASEEAWLAAFGFANGGSGANAAANKEMVRAVPCAIRPEMTRTAAQINGAGIPPNNEWSWTFQLCTNLSQAPTLEGWEGITEVGDLFMAFMFSSCTSLSSLPAGFNLPPNIESVGISFANAMFSGCTNLTTLPAGFNLPQGIMDARDYFANDMFSSCTKLTSLPAGFNLPAAAIRVWVYFAAYMFYGCTSLVSLPAGFTFPQDITIVKESFAYRMFEGCTSLRSLPAGFNLPPDLDVVDNYFMTQTFNGCTSLESLPAGFNLPQNIAVTGISFASYMFADCTSLGELPAGFNLPQNIQVDGSFFAAFMFNGSGGPDFQINDEFCFPAGIRSNGAFSFQMALQLSDSAPMQRRTAASIIGSCPVPYNQRYTFNEHFSDIDYVAVNWGGGGQTPPPKVGAPGTGDLDGDGFVTMSEVLTCARASLGDIGLSPEQLACIDMDNDGFITMFDVLQVYVKAIA